MPHDYDMLSLVICDLQRDTRCYTDAPVRCHSFTPTFSLIATGTLAPVLFEDRYTL